MAGVRLKFNYRVDPSGVSPFTLVQFAAAANHRALLHNIDVQVYGSTGASAPIWFDIGVQNDIGGLAADGTGFVKELQGFAETVQTVVNTVPGGTEPTTTTVLEAFSVHQQSARLWIPPTGPIPIVGGTRLGIRVRSAASFNVGLTVSIEE